MEELKIWEGKIPFETEGAEVPNRIIPHLLDTKEPLPCVIVVPGGGYKNLAADHEGTQIAEFFNSKGFHAVIMLYRVAPNRYPAALADLQRTVRLVRAHANEWKIAPEKLVACGFSAGGHLCASSLLLPDACAQAKGYSKDEIDEYSPIPNGALLCYPVIHVTEDFGHVGSGKNLLGEEAYEQRKAEFNLEQYVTPNTPKVFLFHTAQDQLVSFKNSLAFAEALQKNGVPVELHVFPYGPHGVGLGKNFPGGASLWPELAANWIHREFES